MDSPQQPQNQQPTFYPPPVNTPMSVGQWLGTLALLLIPIANIVLLFVWAFSSDTNVNKRNFARAYLWLILIMLGVYLVLFLIIMGFVFISYSTMSYL